MNKGFRRSVYAIMQGETTETYGTVRDIPAGVKVEVTPTSAEGSIDAYDALYDQESAFGSCGVKLEYAEQPKQMECDLLGHTMDENGVIIYKNTDAAPYVAFGYQIYMGKKAGIEQFAYVWLLKGKFKLPSDSAETKKTGSINYGTYSLEGTFQARTTDGQWRTKAQTGDAVAATFLKAPYLGASAANVNKGALDALYAQGENIDLSSYSTETVTTFKQKLTAAGEELESTQSTQETVNAALNALLDAMIGLAA